MRKWIEMPAYRDNPRVPGHIFRRPKRATLDDTFEEYLLIMLCREMVRVKSAASAD